MEKSRKDKLVPRVILDAAERCITRKGYAHASLRDIADEAGVALSQLHYYYKSKEGLFQEVVQELSDEYIRQVEHRLKSDGTPKERYDNLIHYFRSRMQDEPGMMRLLFDLISMSMWNDAFKSLLSNLFHRISELIRQYIIEESAIRTRQPSVSTQAVAKSVVGAIFGTGMQWVLDPSDDSLIESLNCIENLL